MRKYGVWLSLVVAILAVFLTAYFASTNFFDSGSSKPMRTHYAALQPYSHLQLRSNAKGSWVALDEGNGWLVGDTLMQDDTRLDLFDAWSEGVLNDVVRPQIAFRDAAFETPYISHFSPGTNLSGAPSAANTAVGTAAVPEPSTLALLVFSVGMIWLGMKSASPLKQNDTGSDRNV